MSDVLDYKVHWDDVQFVQITLDPGETVSFILQKLQWDGLAFLHAGWSIVKMNLAEGQSIQVDTWCVVWFESSVDYSIEWVGGIKNALFAGQWFFLTTLTGAWTVYLQSLPFSKMADKVISAAWFSGRSGSTQLWGIWDLASIAGKIIK